MKKFLLGLALGLSTSAVMASSVAYPMYRAVLPDGTVLAKVLLVKEGLAFYINSSQLPENKKTLVLNWDFISKAKAVADSLPDE